jgi:hypothetical protein
MSLDGFVTAPTTVPVGESGAPERTSSMTQRLDQPNAIKVPSPAAVLLIAFVAAAAGAGVLYVDWPFPETARGFTTTGAYFLWISLLCAGAALWAIALFPVVASLRALWRFGENRWRRVAVSTSAIAVMWFVVGAASVLARTSRYKVPFPYVGAKLAVFVSVGGALAICALLGMILVHAGLMGIRLQVPSEAARDRSIRDLLLLREHLQRLLVVEGAIIGAAVLSYAALRNAVLADSPMQPFPPELVLIYGGAFSIALALVWAPIYALSVAVGTRVCDSIVGARGEEEAWPDWQRRRISFADVLDLNTSASETFRSALAILTPLGSALIGLLFNH